MCVCECVCVYVCVFVCVFTCKSPVQAPGHTSSVISTVVLLQACRVWFAHVRPLVHGWVTGPHASTPLTRPSRRTTKKGRWRGWRRRRRRNYDNWRRWIHICRLIEKW